MIRFDIWSLSRHIKDSMKTIAVEKPKELNHPMPLQRITILSLQNQLAICILAKNFFKVYSTNSKTPFRFINSFTGNCSQNLNPIF